ncbi:unnamed protein product [Blepharisma stoltei]|uniref:RRM domain-containing protein n=1 Tax=Blepharisma stoltei TaxID=1481888 RepID=A0AAU9KSG9_9CILI|nr:unnamed protein product [Blepharisma stoltei]
MPKRNRSRSSSYSRSRSRSRSSSSSYSSSPSRSPSPTSRAMVPMPDPDSSLVVDFLHSFQESNAARSDKIDSRIYIDNLPTDTDEAEFTDTFISSMRALGLITRQGSPLLNSWRPKNSTFIFFDFRSVEEANNALTLQGMTYRSKEIKVSRPKHYTGSQPMNANAMSTLFGNYANKNIQKMPLEEICKKNLPSTRRIDPVTKVLVLRNIITASEIQTDTEYLDIISDLRFELEKHGTILSLSVPRCGEKGIGNVYVEYSNVTEASNARKIIATKRFAGKWVDVRFFPAIMYENKDFRESWEINAITNT